MTTWVKQYDADYSEYLGQHYKDSQNESESPAATYVSNHCSWLDPMVLIKTVHPAFTPSTEYESFPLFATLIWALDSIYIPRGGTECDRKESLERLLARQEIIEKDPKSYSPFLIFAEGGTSNNTHILKFKKGAFFSGKKVKPIMLKYSYCGLSPAFEVVEMFPLIILQLSSFFVSVEVGILPDFKPNRYLFETHADKGREEWEIYAWAVRDAMAKTGGFKTCDVPLRMKVDYENYMRRLPDTKHPAEIWANYQRSLGIDAQPFYDPENLDKKAHDDANKREKLLANNK